MSMNKLRIFFAAVEEAGLAIGLDSHFQKNCFAVSVISSPR